MSDIDPVRLAVRDAGRTLRRAHQHQRHARASRHGLPLGRGPGLLPGRALPGLVRHPERPHPALGRMRRRMSRCSGRPPATPTATPSTARAGWSAASTWRAGVTRTELDGTITVLADRYQGQRLNSPNDVVVRSDGSIWFTDPSYGIDHDYEGTAPGARARRLPRLPDRSRHRGGEPRRRRLRPAQRPRLLARRVAALHRRHRRDPRRGRAAPHPRLRRVDGRTLSAARCSRCCDAGFFDGFRFDEARPPLDHGGRRRALLRTRRHADRQDPRPREVSNVCFGGRNRNRLFITATTSLYSVYLLLRGAKTF